MGKRGFVRREASPKEVLEHCLRLAREVAPPTPKGQRGRPWRYDHGLYLALLLFRAFFHLPYRKTEALLQDLMEAPFPSHQSLARYAVQHLDLKLLEALLERLSRELVRGHARLLALVRWERERRWLLPWGGVAGRGYAPDPQLGGKALRRFAPTGGWLLADAGFDGKEVWEALRGEGLRPVNRLRGGGEAREEARVRAREGWDPEVYRFRGVVEGVFGGMKTRLGGAYLWERKPWTAMVRAFLELIAYGLRVLLSLLPPPPGYRAIY